MSSISVKSSGEHNLKIGFLQAQCTGRAQPPTGNEILSFWCPKMAILSLLANSKSHSGLIMGQTPSFGYVAQTAILRTLFTGAGDGSQVTGHANHPSQAARSQSSKSLVGSCVHSYFWQATASNKPAGGPRVGPISILCPKWPFWHGSRRQGTMVSKILDT